MPLVRITVNPKRMGQPRASQRRWRLGSAVAALPVEALPVDEVPVDKVLGEMPVDEVLGEHPDLRAGFAESQSGAASGASSAPAVAPVASPASGVTRAPGLLPSVIGASR